MRKPKITMTVIIIKENVGYSAHVSIRNKFIGTQGEDMDELKANIIEAVNLSFEDESLTYNINEIQLKPDLQSFFDFYKVINVKALSERIGMNQSLLAQYINGKKKPSAIQQQRIFKGVQEVGKELAVQLLI